MKTFDVTRTQYKVSDFLSWQRAGNLSLSPNFQRRSVWKEGAKSYLIDTIVRGLPIPILFVRDRHVDLNNFEPIREVVDGQQRIRTVISYIAPNLLKDFDESRDLFTVSRLHNKELAGKKFEQLSDDIKRRILGYEFSVHVLQPGTNDREVLQIFARMNSTGTRLNAQELRNAEFFGEFKTSMYQTAFKHLHRWRTWEVFTEDNISRMEEVELTSEFAIYMLQGISTKKMLGKIYREKDSCYPEKDEVERRFEVVMDSIDEAFGNDLPHMFIQKKTLFYGLFTTVYAIQFGDDPISVPKKEKRISKQQISALKQAAEDIKKGNVPLEVAEATAKHTTDLKSRETLFNYFQDILNYV